MSVYETKLRKARIDEERAKAGLEPMYSTHEKERGKPCEHLAGYWIRREQSFRCYRCGCQFQVAEIPANQNRKIETWRTR